MAFEFGDVVLIPFPFTNQVATKQRPGVVVSTDAYNRSKPDVVIMAITSQFRPNPNLGEVWLQDWKAAGLLKQSVIKPIFATLERGLITKTLGKLQPGDRDKLGKAIALILGPPRRVAAPLSP